MTSASKNNRHDTLSDVNIFLKREYPDRERTVEVVCSSARRDMDRHAKHVPFKLFCETLQLFPEYEKEEKRTAAWPSHTSIVCWHDCHPFDTVPIPIPKISRNTNTNACVYTVYGVFCSCNCAVAYILERNTYDQQQVLMLFKQMAVDVFKMNITDVFSFEPAPPRIFLTLFGGHLTLPEFRRLSLVARNTLLTPPFISYSMVLEENTRRVDEPAEVGGGGVSLTTHAIRGLRRPTTCTEETTRVVQDPVHPSLFDDFVAARQSGTNNNKGTEDSAATEKVHAPVLTKPTNATSTASTAAATGTRKRATKKKSSPELAGTLAAYLKK